MNAIKRTDPKFSRQKIAKRRKYTEIHLHDEHELYYLVEGSVKYFIGDEIFYVHKGNFIFVPKDVIHKTDSEDCLHNERILISFNDSLNDESMEAVFNELTESKLICVPENKLPLFEEIIHKIELETEKDKKYKDTMINNYIRELLVLLVRHQSVEKQKLIESNRVIFNISDYISTRFDDELSMNSLSKQFAISEGHLSRKFKQVIGMGVNEYIRYIRVLNAAKLLSNTNLSVTEVAQKCGFHDSNYFSTVFKKMMEITPHKYRKKSRFQE